MEQQDSKIHFRLPYHLPNSKEVSVPMEWLLLLGFLMGWVVGLIQGSAKEKQLARDLMWAKAKVHSLELDLVRWSEKNSEWAKGKVQELQEWPRANSYWNFEGPKLQARVLELESQLEQLRSRTLWKE